MQMAAHLKHRLGLRPLHSKLESAHSVFSALCSSRLQPTSATTRCLYTHSSCYTANARAHALHGTSSLYSLPYSTTASASDANLDKGTLDEQLWAHFTRTRPSQNELDARAEALAKIQQAINDYGEQRGFLQLPHAVKLVGSVACGLDRAGSDLELTVADPRTPSGWEPTSQNSNTEAQVHPPYSVGITADFLKKLGFSNVYANNPPFGTGRIATVKATAPTHPPISCELAYNAEAIYASQLINVYVSLNRNIAPMVVFLQRWFDSHGLYKLMRTRKNGRLDVLRYPFNEYTISLLVVAYLQVMRMLPNLQAPFVPAAERVFKKDISQHISTPIVDKLLARASSLPETFLPSDELSDPQIWWYTPSKSDNWKAPMDTRFLPLTSEPVQQWLREYESSLQRAGLGEPTLSELLQGFFQFWAQFPFHEWAVSVRDGGLLWRGRSSDDREAIHNLENAKLRTDIRLSDNYLVRKDTPVHWLKFQRAIRWLLRKSLDLSTAMHFPVVVVDPLTGSYIRQTARVTTLEDMEKFMQVCAAADDAIDAGAGVEDLLNQSVEVIYAEKQKTQDPPEEEEREASPHLKRDPDREDSWHLYLRGDEIPEPVPDERSKGGESATPSIVGRMRLKIAERRSVVEHSLRITNRAARKERKEAAALDSTS